jgi:hypothetical protein
MEKTHQKFDLQEMTLKHLIAMKLYNFEKEIQEIAQTAENEMKIEKQLEEIVEVWRVTKFEVVKYTLVLQA